MVHNDIRAFSLHSTQSFQNWNIPFERTRIEAPVLSCIDLIVEPCFPIRLVACGEGTNKRTEQNAIEAAPDNLNSSSLSGSPLTRLAILNTASIAGDNTASGSSLPDIKT